MVSKAATGDDEERAAYVHGRARSLNRGEQVVINDRDRALTMTDRFTQPDLSPGSTGPYYIIELEGNGTTYHLLCWERAEVRPMLYTESEWGENTENPHVEYDYPGSGERVRDFRTIDE